VTAASQALLDHSSNDIRTAESILEEMLEDNEVLRKSNDVKEKEFSIELVDGICEMRDDTKLVLVDIPGINKAGVSNKYKDHIEDKWGTFDCVIVVMDGRQGVNTEEQVALLKFVKFNLDSITNVPVIIILNKIDDPSDDEQAELVKESCQEIETIFAVEDREKNLIDFLQIAKSNGHPAPDASSGHSTLWNNIIHVSLRLGYAI